VRQYTITCSDTAASDSMVLTVVGSGTIEDVPPMISSMTNRMAQMESQLANVVTLVSGIKGVDLTTVETSINDIKTSLQGTDMSGVESKMTTLASQIGSLTDSSSANTFFGQIAKVNEQLESIGPNAAEAFKKARAAQNEAGSAVGAVAGLKADLAKGNVDKVSATLDDVRRSMEAARESMKEIPKMARIGELYDALNSMAKQMEKLAESKQFKMWTEPEKEKPVEPGAPVEVPESPEQTLKKLTTRMEDMKISLEVMKQMMNEKYEPVVVEMLQGVPE